MASVIIVRVRAMIRMAAIFPGMKDIFYNTHNKSKIFLTIFMKKIIIRNYDGG